MSYRTYEKGGDEISIDAPLKLYHCETQCYLSYCMEPIFLDIAPEEREVDYSLEKASRHEITPPHLRLFYSKKNETNSNSNPINLTLNRTENVEAKDKDQIL